MPFRRNTPLLWGILLPVPATAASLMLRHTRLILWRLLAVAALLLGLLGVVLPGLPTVPFLLLAAWAGAKSWPALEQRLLDHPVHGPVIRGWREHGRVPRKAKWLASLMMLASATAIQFTPTPFAVRMGLPAFLLGIAAWLWSRPE